MGRGRTDDLMCEMIYFMCKLDLVCKAALGKKWTAGLATPDATHDTEKSLNTSGRNGAGRVRKAASSRCRKPSPLQTAR